MNRLLCRLRQHSWRWTPSRARHAAVETLWTCERCGVTE